MYWIAKPFVLPLQFCFITKNSTLFQKNSNETRRNCGLLAAPDFANSGKKHVHFLCKSASEYFLRKSVSKYFLRKGVSNEKTIIKIGKKFRMTQKQDLIFKNSNQNRRY